MGILEHSRRKLTYDDYLRFPDDGLRHEIVDGEDVVTPSPSWDHQRLQIGLSAQLLEQIEDAGLGWVVPAPMDVKLSETDVVQPDVLVIAREHEGQIRQPCVDGPPDLVVEILSPSTASRDRGIKRDAYDRCGVREYWLIDPRSRRAERWTRTEQGGLRPDGSFDRQLASRAFAGVVVDLESLWKKLRF